MKRSPAWRWLENGLVVWIPFALMLLLAGSWELMRSSGTVDRSLLPSAYEIIAALFSQVALQSFWLDVRATLSRAVAGLLLAVVVGVPTGLVMTSLKWIRPVGLPAVDFLRSIPVTSLYPVFVLTLGIGDRGKVGMIFLGCVLIVILHSATGFQRRSRIRHHVATLYGASRMFLLFQISAREALPEILTGIRVSLGLALIIGTLTEMFMGADTGLGQRIMEAYSVYALAKMYAYIVALGLVGYALNRLCVLAEERTRSWDVRR
jgi:ABC-type nitrate/sulfonate/bicarbonate transport system permease component